MPRRETLSSGRAVRVAATLMLANVLARPAHACTMISLWEYDAPGILTFTGTPLRDTVRAGLWLPLPPADPRIVQQPRPSGPTPVYGQRVRVERLGARAARELPAGTREVILVPWESDGMCVTLPWSHGARWIRGSAPGLFRARIRERAEWVDGVPTFDVSGEQPYRDSDREWPPRPRLSAAAMLRFHDELPEPRTAPDSVTAMALLRRLRADPARAAPYPIPSFIRRAERELDEARRASIRPALHGTFRIEVRSGDEPAGVLFLRTPSVPDRLDRWSLQRPDTGIAPRPPEGYRVWLLIARSLDALPTACLDMRATRDAYRSGALASSDAVLPWEAERSEQTPGSWDIAIGPGLIEPLLSADVRTRVRGAIRARSDEEHRGWRATIDALRARGDSLAARRMEDLYSIPPGRTIRLTRDPDGAVRLMGSLEVPGLARPVQLRGELVSGDTYPCSG